MTIDESLRRAITEAVTAGLEEPLSDLKISIEELARATRHAAATRADPELQRLSQLEYLTAEEAAALLRTGRQQIYKLVNAGHLQCTRFGRKQIFARAELDGLMRRNEHFAPTEMTGTNRRQLSRRHRAEDS